MKKALIFLVSTVILFGFYEVDAANLKEVGKDIESVVDEEITYKYDEYHLDFEKVIDGKTYITHFSKVSDEQNVLFYNITIISEDLEETTAIQDEKVIVMVLQSIAKLNGYKDYLTIHIPETGSLEKEGIEVHYHPLVDFDTGETIGRVLDSLSVDLDKFMVTEKEEPSIPDKPTEPDKPKNPITEKLENLVKAIENNDVYKSMIKEGSPAMHIEDDSFTIKLAEDNYELKFKIIDDALYYELEGDIEDSKTIERSLMDSVFIKAVTQSVAVLNGYDLSELTSLDETKQNFDANGLEIERYKYEQTNAAGHVKLEGIKTFKISLTNLKLDIKSETEEPSIPTTPTMATIRLSNVNSNSITLSISYSGSGVCDIYRATADGYYKKITSMSCNDSYRDTNLEPNTKYFYKVGIGELMSNAVEAKTGAPSVTVKNPSTGYVSYGLIFFAIGTLSFEAYRRIKKGNIFRQL